MAQEADIVGRYLPVAFAMRLPPAQREWRGRTVLLLWALGYPLEMAWALGTADDAEQSAFYRAAIAQLDDERLAMQLDATTITRGDGRDLGFGWLGSIEVLVRLQHAEMATTFSTAIGARPSFGDTHR